MPMPLHRLSVLAVASCLSRESTISSVGRWLSRSSVILGCQINSLSEARTTSLGLSCSSAAVATFFLQSHSPRFFHPLGYRGASSDSHKNAGSLLRFPPFADAAPLASIATCPTLNALNDHIQRHSYRYSLQHVAAGLATLSGLSPAHDLLPTAKEAAVTATQAVSASTAPAPGAKQTAHKGDPAVAGHPGELRATAGAATASGEDTWFQQTQSVPMAHVGECARRLALLGHHLMKRDTNVAAMAQCIKGLAGVGLPLTARIQLALPFVKRLRDPSFFFAMRDQPADVLIALLHALSKLPLYAHVQREDVSPIAQVLARVVMSLTPQVASMSAQDACRTTTALVRLGCSSGRREAEVYHAFLRALAPHLREELVERVLVSPDQAVQLLWAYAVVMPGSCSSPLDSASGLTRAAAAAAAPPSVRAAPRHDGVRQMVAALTRLACRALDSHQPMHLVKLVYALTRLGAQREAASVLPQVTPRMLLKLECLNLSALATVASSYHLARVHEPGLLQAVAEQVMTLARGTPLDNQRVIDQLEMCYGARGSHDYPPLREVLHAALRERSAAITPADKRALHGPAAQDGLLKRPPRVDGRALFPAGRRTREVITV